MPENEQEQEQQQEEQQQDEHEAEPDEEYVPKWAKDLSAKIDGLNSKSKETKPVAKKTESTPDSNRDSNGNTAETKTDEKPLTLPKTTVAPKPPSILSKLPKWL